MSDADFQVTFDDPPGGPRGRFTVDIREQRDGTWVLWSPGEHRGPDIVVPTTPALDAWIDAACARWVRPIWYCQWAFNEPAAIDAFLAFVGAERPRR